jgi:hypothetical protein
MPCRHGLARSAFLAGLLVLAAACSPIPTYEAPPPSTPIEVEAPAPAPPSPPVRTEPTAQNMAGPARTEPGPILVVRSSDADNYGSVAAALKMALDPAYTIREVNLAEGGRASLLQDGIPPGTVTIAIGADAAKVAATDLRALTVFCQVYEYAPLLEGQGHVFGVAPLPPVGLQLASWASIAGDVSSVGIIVADGEEALVDEARRAATRLGLDVHSVVAANDKDAVYQFKRFAQTVDGIWLHPNSEILSPSAIQEILDYALTHKVQTIAFNPTLLDWGALISTGASAEDVASAVARVVDAILSGNIAGLDRITPLSRVDVQINAGVARALGVSATAAPATAQQLLTILDDDS